MHRPSSLRALSCLLTFSVLALSDTPAAAMAGICGRPVSGESPPVASDAQYALRASVELISCNVCVCDVDDSGSVTATDALDILKSAVDLPAPTDCPPCDLQGQECPAVVQFTQFSGVLAGCASNDDCGPYAACDTSLGRCRTATESDIGWTGLAHEADIDNPIPSRFFLDCDGPAPCGECRVVAHDPSLTDCRCINDNRKVCFTVAGPDETDCGGELCLCNFGPPMPLLSGNVPTCVLNTLHENPTGTGDVDLGTGTLHITFGERVFLGTSLTTPCPLCVDDPNPANGEREGTCVGGVNDGQSCDAQGFNFTFPPPTGAFYSLDCFPEPGANVTGRDGILLPVDLTTSSSALAANLACAEAGPGSDLSCPCRLCSDDTTRACRSDEECAQANAGTCSSNGSGTQPMPNNCTGGLCDAAADDSGNEEGLCSMGPDDSYCDQLVRPDGSGLIGCATNIDCAPTSIGVDAGNCTLSQDRPCFLDPIVSQGRPSPFLPLSAGTYCAPPTASAAINTVVGLPGPGRLILQNVTTLYCKTDPHVEYTPGVGGCPQ